MSFDITLAFLQAVKENNNTQWLHTYWDLYQQEKLRFIDFIQKVLDKLTKINPDFSELTPKDCVFRFNRDIRFSKEKHPYKWYFGAVIAPWGKKSNLPWFYIHLEPGNKSIIAGWLYYPPTQTVHQIRHNIAKYFKQRNKLISRQAFKKIYWEVLGKDLIKIPRWYDANHIASKRFLHKARYVDHNLSDKEIISDNFLEKIIEYYKIIKPFNDFLNQI